VNETKIIIVMFFFPIGGNQRGKKRMESTSGKKSGMVEPSSVEPVAPATNSPVTTSGTSFGRTNQGKDGY
jgi:hypothetical protein